MSFIDYIKNLFNNNKTNTKITTKPLSKIKGASDSLECILTDKDNKPLSNQTVVIEINGVPYNRKTDSNGVANLPIGLDVGTYTGLCEFKETNEYNGSTAYAKVRVSPKIVVSNFTMNKDDGSQFTVKTTDNNGNGTTAPITLNINGVDYNKRTDSNGLFSTPIGLDIGTYKAIIRSIDSVAEATITVKPKVETPAPSTTKPTTNCSSPWTQTPLLLNNKAGSLGQTTPYSCGPHSLMQAFYHLTGINMPESTIMQWAGTTTSGTGHQGLNTAVAMFNKKYNQNIKIAWKNLSDFGSSTNEQFRNIGKLKCEGKYVFFHILYRNQYGHYETYKTNHGVDTRFDIANSLGSRSGNGYVGYIENRSYTVQRQYISGISQPSVAILWK